MCIDSEYVHFPDNFEVLTENLVTIYHQSIEYTSVRAAGDLIRGVTFRYDLYIYRFMLFGIITPKLLPSAVPVDATWHLLLTKIELNIGP